MPEELLTYIEIMEESRKGTLYITIGIPGSGKTTAAAKYGKVFSSDAIREELFGDEAIQYDLHFAKDVLSAKGIHWDSLSEKQQQNKALKICTKAVFDLLDQRVKEALEAGEDVVYDATNIRESKRKKLISKFKNDARTIEAIYLPVSLKKALHQNASRNRKVPEHTIRKMHHDLQPPKLEEGFSTIIQITENPPD